MPFCCIGGLINAIFLYRGVSKMPFCCIGDKIFIVKRVKLFV